MDNITLNDLLLSEDVTTNTILCSVFEYKIELLNNMTDAKAKKDLSLQFKLDIYRIKAFIDLWHMYSNWEQTSAYISQYLQGECEYRPHLIYPRASIIVDKLIVLPTIENIINTYKLERDLLGAI